MNRILMIFTLLCCTIISSFSQSLPLLRTSENGRYLVTEKGQPFFWLGGTAWELLHRLDREETLVYLKDRAGKGFTVIQTVILAELDGLNTPNAYGHLPLIENDPTKLNEAYFEHVDFVIRQAEALGLYVALLPTWGDKFHKKWGVGPEIFTPDNAEKYGELLAERYQNFNNIIWVLGGDRGPEKEVHYKIIRRMAKGIRNLDKHHLITYHPWGGKMASEFFSEEWLDLDMFQSGHDRRTEDYDFVLRGRDASPIRPVINGEPRYENIPDRFWEEEYHGWLDDSDVRTSAYWTMLAGAAGYTYGCNDIWQMYSIDRQPQIEARTGWYEALNLPGSKHAGIMKKIFEIFPWQQMRNEQKILLNKNPQDSAYVICSISEKKDFIFAYTPMGRSIHLDLSKMEPDEVEAYWFNPRSGKSKRIGGFMTNQKPEFKPWSFGKGSDFLLVVMNSNSKYKLSE